MGIRWLYGALALASLGAAPSDTPAAAPDARASLPSAAELAPPNTARTATAPADAAPPLLRSPWPELAAVFPGVLVHGFGTWLQGRRKTSERLLMLEGASLLALALGGVVIYETGAARDLAGPAMLTIATGVGTFGSSLLANLYATWAPPAGWGEPQRRLPRLVSALGYTYVADALLGDHHFMTARVDGRFGAWHVGVDAAISPSPGREQLAARAGFRWLGPRATRQLASDGSYLEPRLGVVSERFDRYGFATRGIEAAIEGRLDSARWLPDVHGAFFQAAVGLARHWTEFDVPGTNVTEPSDQLLVRSGFGLYIGARSIEASPALAGVLPGGEVEIYYDHRRDGLAGGIKTLGPNSGFAGHVGLRAEYYPSTAWGVNASIERGSTWVLGSAVSFRTGLP